MKTYVMEILVTAKTSVSHNGGEQNGVVTQFRREKFVQPDGKIANVPLISGNSIRGKMRDIAAVDLLTKEDGVKIKLDADNFNLMFAGGSLESTGSKTLNLEKVRKMRKDMPILSVFGCSIGNIILPGKLQIGKMIPICKETLHLIPQKFTEKVSEIKGVDALCQLEMYTRKDDTKDENLRDHLTDAAKEGEKIKSQMQYYIETISAGTLFFWKVCLMDATDIETGAFLNLLQKFSDTPNILGGNGRIGLGDIAIEIISTDALDSTLDFKNDDFANFINDYEVSKKDLSEYFENGKKDEVFA